jgi:O-antigen/teichoic acid export membrane protein
VKTLFARNANAVWALLDQIGVSGCTFLLTLTVARLATVAEFSAYGLSVTVTLFISAMHKAYLTQPLSVLGVAEQAQALGRRFRAVLMLHLCAWPLMLALLLGVGARYFPGVEFSLAVFFYIAAYLLQEAVRRLCFTTGQLQRAFTMDVMAYGGQLLVLWAVYRLGPGALHALLIGGCTFLISCAWGWRRTEAVYLQGGWPGVAELRRFVVGHWAQSRWICYSQVFMFGSFMLVPFQLAEFGGVLWVAQYNAVGSILNVLNILRQTMGNYLPITAARVYHEQGFKAFDQTMNRLSVGVLAGALLVVGGLLLAGDMLVALLYGERYAAAARVLPIASIGPLVAMVSFVSQAGGMALGKTAHIFFSYVAGTACSLLLAPVLIPHWQLEGAVWVANVGYIVPTLWHWWAFKRDCRAMRHKEVMA